MKIVQCDQSKVKMQIWDTAGQERYRKITRTFYNGASGIILVYDITDEQSFMNIEDWMRQIDEHAQTNVCKIVVGNKCDRPDRKISTEQG
jgi:small GTP-binding protein